MIDRMAAVWNQLGSLSKFAVLLLFLCLAPVLTSILRRISSWPPAVGRHTVRIPLWVLLEAGAFLVAVGFFWVSFLKMSGGYEGTGRCVGILNDLRDVYISFLILLMIPVAIIVVWLVSQLWQRGRHRDA